MKRVVLIRSNAVKNDPAVEKVAAALMSAGHRVTVLAWDRDGEYDMEKSAMELFCGSALVIRFGIPGVFSGGLKKNAAAMAEFLKRISRWLKENCDEYDIIHAFDLDTGLAAKKAAARYKKKLCYHILDFYAASRFKEESIAYKLIRRIEISVINKADACIVCTEARKKQIEGSKPESITVIHNTPGYISLSEIEAERIDSDRIKIVYVGCFEEVRLIRELIECVKEDERFELHIGGFGLIEDFVKKSAEECKRIVFYGKLPYRRVMELEAACDIMTAMYVPGLANHKYTAPNKLYEALMLGKPIIMCENTGWDDVIKGENIGVIIDCTKEGLKKGLSELAARKAEWEIMAQNAQSLYKDRYSWDIMKKRLQELYSRL